VNANSKHLPAAIDKIPLKMQAFLHRSRSLATREKGDDRRARKEP